MNLTIRLKLYGLGLLGLAGTLIVGFTGLYGISNVASGIDDVGATSSAIRNHMEASMFLDLSRGDLAKTMTAAGDAQDTAAAEFADHSKLFQERLTQALQLTREAKAKAVLEKEQSSAEAYLASAAKISAVRKNPAEAAPLFGPFLQGYQDLRTAMDANNDMLAEASKKSQSDAARVVRISKLAILVMRGVLSVLLLLIAATTARDINRRLATIIEWLKQMASGDLTIQAQDAHNDELGQIAHWFRNSLERLRATISGVASSANGVNSAAGEVAAVSSRMSINSEEATNQADVANSTTEVVTRNLHTVATGTEEMSASIREISKSVEEAASVAGKAVEVAKTTNQLVAKLGESSAQIGAVVKVITSIAQQTNLLALNATIEAARAGDAGKGFAVVANEVKELASQTARATEDIRGKIEAIQRDTRSSVEAISSIGAIIDQIFQISNGIAVAVEEQNSTTSEIARNITEGARGSSEIAHSISGAAASARDTNAGAVELQKATQRLESMSVELRGLVGQFRYEVAAGVKESLSAVGAD
jgi:methyl-accepting chemotaxis protein